MKTAMTIEYDGAAYYGFQLQKQQNSVQAELEKALAIALRQKVRVYCAGRTDTGVNALGQVVHFAAEYRQTIDELIYSLNSLLPRDIAIRYAAHVPENFHARFSCLAREYVYVICNAPYRPGTLWFKSLWLRGKLDWAPVRHAAEHLIGEKDFASFTKAALVKSGERTFRRIDAVEIIESTPYIFIYIRGSGFLHNMIRILTGTLIDVARGKIAPESLREIVGSADRLAAGVTQKPDALYFLHAEYADYPQQEAMHWLRRLLLGETKV
ncbi:MAG: tRNA pseudouridine(38-40) synthase TruA [Leptospiraceae bacterium]|nr:tRNA pseudouridine(38-40) synthase TruA [Leptospiraceae bacterium]